MSDEVFKQYSAYYDLLYRDKNYPAESDYIGKTLRNFAPSARQLLEFGSGTGGHGMLLAQQGFNVFGIERSPSMVEAALQAKAGFRPPFGAGFDCATGDVCTVDLKRTFDVVTALFHVISYQTTNDDALAAFQSAGRHLSQGGIFFFDVWHGPAVYGERPSVRVKRVENEAIHLTRIAEPAFDTNAGVVTVRYTMLAKSKVDNTLTTFREEHHMRLFFPTEIDFLARQTGFQIVRSEEFLTSQTPSEKTWGVAYVLRKIA